MHNQCTNTERDLLCFTRVHCLEIRSKENGEHAHEPCTAESEFALERGCLELQ